jgi:hypothetical protein
LAALRERLTGPQPRRSTVRRPWRDVTDLAAGDVLAYQSAAGRVALFRVGVIDESRYGVVPVLIRLDFAGRMVPRPSVIRELRDRAVPTGRGGPRRVSRHRRRDPGWRDVGFRVVATVPARRVR